MVAPVKTTIWGGLHGSLALVLNDADYATVTKNIVTLSAPLTKLTRINPKINKLSNPYKILTLQEEMKTLPKEFELQEAVTTIGVQRIINSVEEQYIKELNEDYFVYTNQTIKMLLTHLCTNWCKVMMKERTNATEAFYAWAPLTTHLITFGHQLNKQQKKYKNINVIISEEAKTLHSVGQMYKSNCYTEKQMTKYKMQTDVNKTWLHTRQFSTKLFAQRNAYRDGRAANSSFDSAAHINNIPTNCSLVPTSSDITTRDLYIESLKESLAAAREYVAKECTPTPDKPDPLALLCTKLDAQRQFDLIMKQNSALLVAMAKGNNSGGGEGSCGGGGGGGSGGGGVGSGNRRHDRGTKAMCPNCNKTVIHVAADCVLLPANKDNIPSWYKPPKRIDRDKGPSIVLMLMIGLSVINQHVFLQPSPYANIGPHSLGRHRVQLVRWIVQEPLVRGSNPSGARVQRFEGC
jgi:hypothetical protein